MKDGRSPEVGSVSFDRAAAFYDATRLTAFEGIEDAIAVLDAHLPEGGTTLEIGVGTGALALPLARVGRRVVGVDLSGAMLAKLVEKDRRGPGPCRDGRRDRAPVRARTRSAARTADGCST